MSTRLVVKVASLEAVARGLNDAGMPFIVVVGIAVNAHGYGRFTQDVDLVVKLAPAHVRNAFAALAKLGYSPRVPVTAEQFADAKQRARFIADKGMQVLSFYAEVHRDTPLVRRGVTEHGAPDACARGSSLAPAIAIT